MKGSGPRAKAHISLPKKGVLCGVRWTRWSSVRKYDPERVNTADHKLCKKCRRLVAKEDADLFETLFPDDDVSEYATTDDPPELAEILSPYPSNETEHGGGEQPEGEKEGGDDKYTISPPEFYPSRRYGSRMRCWCNRAMAVSIGRGFFGPVLTEPVTCRTCGRTFKEGTPASNATS